MKTLLSTNSDVVHDIFPPDVIDAFNNSGPKSTLRLRHAVDWALHGGAGLEHLWVAFLPRVHDLEKPLVYAAIRWRKGNDLPPLLNKEDPG